MKVNSQVASGNGAGASAPATALLLALTSLKLKASPTSIESADVWVTLSGPADAGL